MSILLDRGHVTLFGARLQPMRRVAGAPEARPRHLVAQRVGARRTLGIGGCGRYRRAGTALLRLSSRGLLDDLRVASHRSSLRPTRAVCRGVTWPEREVFDLERQVRSLRVQHELVDLLERTHLEESRLTRIENMAPLNR
jgi:hypothetical protein